MIIKSLNQRIAELERIGCDNIRVVQSKRYVNADIISAHGKWYPVVTTANAANPLSVVYDMKPDENSIPWLDENGRAVSEVSYG